MSPVALAFDFAHPADWAGGYALAVSLGVASLSLLLTHLLIRLSGRLQLTARPRSDRWHKAPTPDTGGVAIFLSCAAAYLAVFRGQYTWIAAGAVVLAAAGFLDDRFQLRPIVKLSVQVLVAALVVSSGVIFPATSFYFVNALFSLLWIVGITNAFNLIDNMDGLCAGVALIICVFRILFLAASGHWLDAQLFAVLAAAFAGFLVFNLHPARIFMGDCGSMFAGFTLAALTIAGPLPYTKAFLAGVFYPALTFTYPIFDTVLVSVLRRAAGRPISVGGRDHSSHRLASLGMTERKAVAILWGLTAAGSLAALLANWMPKAVIAIGALLVAGVSMMGVFLGTLPAYSLPQGAPLISSFWFRRIIPSMRAAITVAVEAMLAALALLIAFLLRFEGGFTGAYLRQFYVALPIVIACHALLSAWYRTYNFPWRWFGTRDVAPYIQVAVLGAAISSVAIWMLGMRNFPRGVVVLYCFLFFALCIALRVSLRFLTDTLKATTPKRRVAILGATAEGEALATLLDRRTDLELTPVAFLDRDPAKKGTRIHGIPVHCVAANIRESLRDSSFDAVVVSDKGISNGELNQIAQSCHEAGVEVLLVSVTVRTLAAFHGEATAG
jgi:UDP-GlcNAc:undecaprenyl-phosphate GlcNAc-1-phosphate transferase